MRQTDRERVTRASATSSDVFLKKLVHVSITNIPRDIPPSVAFQTVTIVSTKVAVRFPFLRLSSTWYIYAVMAFDFEPACSGSSSSTLQIYRNNATWRERERETERGRQTEGQTERDRDRVRQTDRQTKTERDRETDWLTDWTLLRKDEGLGTNAFRATCPWYNYNTTKWYNKT